MDPIASPPRPLTSTLSAALLAAALLAGCGDATTVAGGLPTTDAVATTEPLLGALAPRDRAAGPRTRVALDDVRLEVARGAVLDVAHLTGTIVPTGEGAVPALDRPASFAIDVAAAEVALDAAALTALARGYVFAYPDSPLDDVAFRFDGDRIVQTGTVEPAVPFEMTALPLVTPGGELRLRPLTIRSGGRALDSLMSLFTLETAEAVNRRQERGVAIAGDHLAVDPGRILPAPKLAGRLTAARVAGDRLHLTYGARRAAADGPPAARFTGGTLRAGTLTLHDARLELTDADPGDPLHLSFAALPRQLLAATGRVAPDLTLTLELPDLTTEVASTP